MPLTLKEAQEADIPRLVEIMYNAFSDDPWERIVWPQTPPPEARSPTINQMRNDLLTDPNVNIMKVVDQELDSIIAFAEWNIYRTERPESEWKSSPEPDVWDEGTNVEAGNAFREAKREKRRKLLGGVPHCCLNIVVCHKDHQRRGAGKMLLRWGTDIADEVETLPCYLEASVAGRRLYSAFGFEDVDSLDMDMGSFGGKGLHQHFIMIRPAKTSQNGLRGSVR